MGYVEDLRGTRQGRGRLRWRVRCRDPSGHERAKSFARKVEAERFLRHVEADKLKGVGGGGCIPASLFKMFCVASGVLPPPDRRSNRELGRRREAPTHRCQCRRVPEATRSASLSSTSHRFAARPDPTRVSGRRAPDRERAARERRPSPPGPDPTPRGPDRGWSLPANDGSRIGSAGIGPSQLIPTGPPATTPRSSPRRFRIAAHSMTNRSSGSQICSAEW